MLVNKKGWCDFAVLTGASMPKRGAIPRFHSRLHSRLHTRLRYFFAPVFGALVFGALVFCTLVCASCFRPLENYKHFSDISAFHNVMNFNRRLGSDKEKNPTVILVATEDDEWTDGYIRQVFNGILRFYDETIENQVSRGVLYDVVNSRGAENVGTDIQAICEEGAWDIIVMPGLNEVLFDIAPHFPEQKFVLTDNTEVDMPNIRKYNAAEQEGSYLVGAAIAFKAVEDGVKGPVFGFIGGENNRTINRFAAGYIQGIRSVLPDAKALIYYVNSWSNPDKTERKSKEWFNNGVYAIFTAAGGSGLGNIRAASNFRKEGRDVWAIGVDVDQFDDGLYAKDKSSVYTSMVKRVDNAIYDSLISFENGEFSGGEAIMLDLAHGGVDWTDTNPEMSKGIKDKLNKIERDIIEHRIEAATELPEDVKYD